MGYTLDQVTWWSAAVSRQEAGRLAALLVHATGDQIKMVLRAMGGK